MPSAAARAETGPLARRLPGEALGTAFLLAAVVGSGMMAERLTHDVALRLLCNTIATGAALFVLIVVFAPVSGAHFNPAVTMVSLLKRGMETHAALAYVLAQVLGAIGGVFLAHAMFGADVLALGVKARSGFPQSLSEAVATFGLVLTISGTAGRSREAIAGTVALYITAAYWFTASTSFANPAGDDRTCVHAVLRRHRSVGCACVHRGAVHRRDIGMVGGKTALFGREPRLIWLVGDLDQLDQFDQID